MRIERKNNLAEEKEKVKWKSKGIEEPCSPCVNACIFAWLLVGWAMFVELN